MSSGAPYARPSVCWLLLLGCCDIQDQQRLLMRLLSVCYGTLDLTQPPQIARELSRVPSSSHAPKCYANGSAHPRKRESGFMRLPRAERSQEEKRVRPSPAQQPIHRHQSVRMCPLRCPTERSATGQLRHTHQDTEKMLERGAEKRKMALGECRHAWRSVGLAWRT